MKTLSLTPLYRNSIGFDRFMDLFDTAFAEQGAPAYPPYNIEKVGENAYRIVMAVAGFSSDDLNISAQENTLTISGRVEAESEDTDVHYLHKGIASRAFERKFSLTDHVKVSDAELRDGLLSISLVREVPEEKKPQTIAIKNGEGKRITAKKQ
jgi:molecular chaperone IbpA